MKGLSILVVFVTIAIVGAVVLMISDSNSGDNNTSNPENRAEQLYASGQFEQALDEVEKEIEQRPENAEQYVLLGKIRYSQANFEEALNAFNKAIELDESAAEAFAYRARLWLLHENDIASAKEDNSIALSIDSSIALAYVTEADIAVINNDNVKASQSYAQAILIDEALEEAYIRRGEFLFNNGYYLEAKADFDTANSLNGPNATVLAQRAHSNYYLGEFELSLQDALDALRLDNDVALAYAILGLINVNETNSDEALQNFTLALEKDPNLVYAYIYRGRFFEAKQDADAAFADLDRGIELEPTLALGYLHRGIAHQAQGNLDKAIDDYTASIERAENSTMAHFMRAEAYRSKRDYANALLDYGEAIELHPQFTDAYLARAEIWYFEEQNYTAAIDDLTMIITLAPDAYVYRLRSLAYAGLKQPQQARLDRDTAVEMEPEKPSIIKGGYDIQINRIWGTKEASGIRPANGQFLVIEIGLYNYSNEKLCLLKSDFEAVVDGRKILPERMYQIEQEFFGGNKSYPPTEDSTCLNDARQWLTFLTYDVSEDITTIAINYSPERETVNFELWLLPEADSDYRFAIAEIGGERQIEFGELVYLEETLEDVVAVEKLPLDNCNSDAERTTTINLNKEEIREITVENVQGIDGVSGAYGNAEVSVGIRYFQTESDTQGTRVTYEREESFTIPPRSIANYEIVWSTISKQGELEVMQGAQTYTVPFRITDALKVDVRSLPATACEDSN